MPTHPEVLWAQRSSASKAEENIIYLTVNLPDIVESTLQYTLNTSSISFKANTTGGEKTDYAFDLDFFADVDPESSTKRLTSRSLLAILRKKELKSEYWPRLTKEKLKTPFIKTDFSKWVDEDEQHENPNLDDELGDGGFGGGGFPGGGFPGGGLPGGGFPGGDFDFSKLPDDLGTAPSASAESEPVDSESDDDGPPGLEDAEPSK